MKIHREGYCIQARGNRLGRIKLVVWPTKNATGELTLSLPLLASLWAQAWLYEYIHLPYRQRKSRVLNLLFKLGHRKDIAERERIRAAHCGQIHKDYPFCNE